jgi:hypothetical protein
MDNGLERICKEAVVTLFKVLSQQFALEDWGKSQETAVKMIIFWGKIWTLDILNLKWEC